LSARCFFLLLPQEVIVELELKPHRVNDRTIFVGGRKLVRVRVEGLIDDRLPAVCCRLDATRQEAAVNDSREPAAVVRPRWENGALIARFAITPTKVGYLTATFTLEDCPTVAPLTLTFEVRSETTSSGCCFNGRLLH
jgi:hypothetical protein